MVVFQIEYSDIGSVSYAELWAAEPFEAKPWLLASAENIRAFLEGRLVHRVR